MKFDILFQDQDVLVVNKPAGLPSQPTVDPRRENMFDAIKKSGVVKNCFLHHRLDKDTSGVFLVATHPRVNKALTEMFRNHEFQKTYNAFTKPGKDVQPQWEVQNHLVSRRQNAKSVKVFRTESGGDFAQTQFRVLDSRPLAHWIEAKPLTGRTHQIRVHCLNSGVPILGDWLYGGKDPLVPRLMLHASKLEFKHPHSGEFLSIEAPLPQDMKSVWARISS